MHRLGFLPEETLELGNLLSGSASMRVVSVFTHLVASENPAHDDFTREQGKLFEEAAEFLYGKLPYTFLRHACNTSGILRHPELHFDMVRLGIGLFGISNADANVLKLQTVSRLLTTVAQVKKVKAGQSVGYGRQAILNRDSLIATVRIGYADGYRRQLGNGAGFMYIQDTKAPVVGNVCMDMTMLDVTGLPNVQPGDRVEVFGEQISVSELAQLCTTIPYEIMTGIGQRVKRVLVED
jgi:alanine racemase